MALGDVIARLAVNLTLETAAFEEGADAAEKRLAQSAKKFDQIGGKMVALGAKMTAAFTAPLAAFGIAALGMAGTAKEMKNAAQVAGESFETFQRGAAAAQTVGVEFDKFGDILKDTREKLGDFAANGGGELADFFTNIAPKVGVTIDMFRDLSGSQALQLYYDSLVKAGVPQQQMVFYMESIADEGSGLIPILRDNGKAMKELGASAAVISDEDAESLARYTQAQSNLSSAFTRLQVAIAKSGLVEVVTAFIDKLAGLVDWFAALPAPIQTVGVAIAAFVAALGPVIVVLGAIVSSASTLFAALGVIGTAMASTGTAAGAATVVFAALRAAVTTFITALGPWGIAIAAISTALVFLIKIIREGGSADQAYTAALDRSTAASKRAEKAANDLVTAHGKAREEALRLARAEAENIKKKLESARASVTLARAELIRARSYQAAQANAAASAGGTAPGLTGSIMRMRGDATASKAQENLKAAEATAATLASALDKVEKAINAPEAPIFVSAVKPDKDKTKGSKAAAPTMATAEQQQREIDQLAMEELQAKMALATSAEERAAISREMLAAEKQQRFADVKNNKEYTAEQKKAQLAYLDRLYGPESSEGEIEVTNSLETQKLNREIAEEQARQANDMLAMQAGTLEAWADIEPNTRERARLEAEALTLHQQIQRNLLEQQIATGEIADAEKARALLASQQGAQTTRLNRDNMSPLQRYGFDLQSSVTNINDAMESIQVDALDGLTNSIAGAIAGTQKLGEVFKNVAQQIIADLIRIQLQKAIVGTLSKALGGIGGGLKGLSPVSSGSGFGGSENWNDLPKFATGTNSTPRGLALVGERGPELVQFSGGQRVYNNADSKAMMGGRSAAVQIVPSPYFDAVVDQRAAGVATPISIASGMQARGAATADMAQRARRRIPGR
jgi:hypothetical protein